MASLLGGIKSILMLKRVPAKWRLPCYLGFGLAWGIGLATLRVSRATSYMSDAPEACVNCHVMRPFYATWARSSHASRATCNDCHVPHDSVLSKYAFKARDGIYHSYVFTTHTEPQVIHISDAAIGVVENNCRRCHAEVVNQAVGPHQAGDRRCWECHREVPHGRVHSLSGSPAYNDPQLPDPLGRDEMTIGGRSARPQKNPTPNSEPHP